VNAPESFAWWASRTKGNVFPFVCPKCATEARLLQRVVQSNRKCAACGFVISVASIDSRLEDMEPIRQKKIRDEKTATIFKGLVPVVLFVVVLVVGFRFVQSVQSANEPKPDTSPPVKSVAAPSRSPSTEPPRQGSPEWNAEQRRIHAKFHPSE
jgi:transcription initiation factor TFIIIB Brf1 subunit/transcription initiation factor TFIIB